MRRELFILELWSLSISGIYIRPHDPINRWCSILELMSLSTGSVYIRIQVPIICVFYIQTQVPINRQCLY